MFDVIVATLCLMRLAFPVNAHQMLIKSKLEVHPAHLPDPPFQFFGVWFRD